MEIGTPSNIEVLLHCHCSPESHERQEAPAVASALSMLLGAGCIEVEHDQSVTAGQTVYTTTRKGASWVKALCNVECPKSVYVDAQGNVLENNRQAAD